MKTTRIRSVAAALIAAGIFVAACSSDGSESSSDTAATEPTDATSTEATDAPSTDDTSATTTDSPAEASGEPIKVMVTGTIESPAFSIPSIPMGAQIAIDELNAAGGVNGRPLELVVCNDELNPNNAAACIQTAVQEGVVALVGGLSLFEPSLLPLLATEGIPWVGATPSTDFTSPVLFPIASDGASAFTGIGAAAMLSGCETPAIIISAQATPTNSAFIKAGIEANGGTVAAELQANGPDFAPLVESALADGADCIASGVSPAEIGGLLAAVAGRVPITTVDGSVPDALLAGLGEAADGLQVVSGFRLPGAGDANVLALQETTTAIDPLVSLDQFWFTGYSGVKAVAEALQGADDVSGEAVTAGLATISDFDTGFGPVVDFTAPNPVEKYARIFNPNMYVWEISGGAYTLVQDDPIDMQSSLELLGQ